MLTRTVLCIALLLSSASAQAMGFIPQVQNTVSQVCAIEDSAHGFYVAFIGPWRPDAAKAREAKFYAKVKQLCAIGASTAAIAMAAAQAQQARQ